MRIMEYYDKLNSKFHGKYWKSWLGHFATFFLVSCITAIVGIPAWFSLGGAIFQEATQFEQWRFSIKKYDYFS